MIRFGARINAESCLGGSLEGLAIPRRFAILE